MLHYHLVQGCNNVIIARKIITIIVTLIFLTMMTVMTTIVEKSSHDDVMMTLMLLNWITVMVVMLKVMRRKCYGSAGKVALLRIWPGLAQTSYVTLATWLPVLLMVMNIWYALISIAAIGKGDDEYEVRNPIQRCNGQKILFPRTRLFLYSYRIN